MDKLKQWVALTGVAVLAVLGGGWSLLVAPERSEAAELLAQVEAEDLTNQQLRTQLEVLRARAEELPSKKAELAEVARKVPAGASLPELVRALTAAARDADVVLTSVTPGTPVPLAAQAPAAAPTDEPAAAQPAPSGLSEVPLVLEVEGDFYELEQYLALLEDLPRAVRVTALSVQAGDDAGAQRGTLRSIVTASAYTSGAAAPSAPPAAAPAAPQVQDETGTSAAAPTSGTAAGPTGTSR